MLTQQELLCQLRILIETFKLRNNVLEHQQFATNLERVDRHISASRASQSLTMRKTSDASQKARLKCEPVHRVSEHSSSPTVSPEA